MLGDVGLVAKLLSEVFGYIVDPTGYEQLAREHKLKLMQEGIDEAVLQQDWARCDALFAELRSLRANTGP